MGRTRTLQRVLVQRIFTAVIAAASGCAYMATERIEDQAAPRDAYKQLTQARATSKCERKVQLFRSTAEVLRPYRQASLLSATCSPGTPSVCDEVILERACALGADAVILEGASSKGTPWSASTQTLSSRGGRAIRWTD